MIEHYGTIKSVHVAAIYTSGTLFLLRGLAVQARQGWAMAAPLRYLSYAIDTVLLVAALALLAILPHGLYANGWLTVKLTLVVIYVVLGSYALKRGRTPRARLIAWVAALLVFVSIYLVARTHHPLGPLLWLRS